MKTKAVKPSLLPTELSVPSEDVGEYLTLIYGREKAGKTTLAAQFPDALFMGFEPGTKALRVYSVAIDKWQTALDVVKELKKNPTQFKTVIVDTVDLAYKMAEEAVCSRMGYDHPSDGEWGKGWSAVKDEMRGFLLDLAHTGRGVVLISHESEKEYQRDDGRKTTRIVPSMPKGARDVIEPMLDIWLYYAITSDGKRQLVVKGDDLISAGTRVKEGFVGISRIEAGDCAEDAYKNLITAFKTKE